MENLPTARLEDKIENLSFEIYDPTSDETTKKNIKEFGSKWLVLFFYPADFTFVCPTELKELNSVYQEIQSANAEILVISRDTVFSHKRRKETEPLLKDFKIQMISDRKGDLSNFFGIMNTESGNSERGTFIISPDGILKSIEIVTEPIGRNTNELIRKIKALDFVRTYADLACPASRNVGGETLRPSIKIAGLVGEEMK